MGQERIQYLQIRLSSKHPRVDVCDYHAGVDKYGLGPGVYPKAEAPLPPYHPNCFCLAAPMVALDPKAKPRLDPKAERAFLAGLPPKQAARVAGSRERLQRALDGESLEDIYNAGKDEPYKWRRAGVYFRREPQRRQDRRCRMRMTWLRRAGRMRGCGKTIGIAPPRCSNAPLNRSNSASPNTKPR